MVLVFGDHRLDSARRELLRGACRIELEPKAFDLLAYLVKNRDRVVSKDDLLEAVWDGRIVSESALTTRINAVRRALDDDGASQRFIRTLNRKGFRFVGEVTEVPDTVADHAPLLPEKPSLVVLPFENLTGNPKQDYFVDGMVEEITTAIARLPWLSVIARNSSFAYKGKAVDVKRIGQELDVRYVLEGSVRKAGKRVRIAGQLIDTTTAAHIWAERFDGMLDDVFDLQDRVASGVAGAIAPMLRSAEIVRSARKPTESLDAYDFYLRALAQAYRRNAEGLAKAVSLLQKALELDAGYAPAMALMSGCRNLQRNRHWIPDAGPEVVEAIRLARQAIAIAGDNPDVLATSGMSLAFLAGDNNAALNAIDRAITLNPNFALAFGHRALVLIFLNRPDDAVASAQHALRLSPRDPHRFVFVQAMAFAHLAAGRYEAGMPWAEEALRENGGLPALRFKLSLCGHLGRREEAAECLRRLKETHPDPTVPSVMRGIGKGIALEIVTRLAEGLCMAGLPEQ
jgi:TolB-like protein